MNDYTDLIKEPEMSDIEDLVAELRIFSDAYWPRERRGDINPSRLPGDNPFLARVLDRAADALEQTVKERDAWRRWTTEAEIAHDEDIALLSRVEAERDALAVRIERALELVERDAQIEVHNEQVPIHQIGDLQRRPTSSDYRRILSEGESS